MKLSAPIYHLKRNARLLSRKEKIPLHAALDRIASDAGFRSWSLLVASVPSPVGSLYGRLRPGDLLLVAARPGHGKTLVSLELAVEAMKSGNRGVLFTLEYAERKVLDLFRAIGAEPARFEGLFELDSSDAICADHIVRALAKAPRGTLVVVDYLQLLDQKREKPELMDQVLTLRSFAREKGLILVFISQIDRSYDESRKPLPDMHDVRLPNPLDLSLFNKACFLNNGKVRFQATG